jgi:hypothetical protein
VQKWGNKDGWLISQFIPLIDEFGVFASQKTLNRAGYKQQAEFLSMGNVCYQEASSTIVLFNHVRCRSKQ